MNQDRISAYYRLAKPGITRMVMITAAFGYLLGAQGVHLWGHFLLTLLGIGLGSAGSSVLNNFLERDIDGLMDRTRGRELPRGRIDPEHALGFGLLLIFLGLAILLMLGQLLTAFLVLLAAFLYVVVYTPLKRRTWLNTSIGAIPGALPISCGWVAGINSQFRMLDKAGFPIPPEAVSDLALYGGAFLLFALLFAWQHPHFYAIAWMYRDDYEKAGFKMLSVVDKSGARLFTQVILYSLFLFAISVLPALIPNMGGRIYLFGASLLGLFMVYASLEFVKLQTHESAKKCLRASIIYLPAMLLVTAVDLLV